MSMAVANTQAKVLFWIEQIAFSGGETLGLTAGSTTILVGPNNSGKTSTLRELRVALGGSLPGPVVKSLIIQKRGTSTDMKEWLNQNVALARSKHSRWEMVYSWLGAECPVEGTKNYQKEWGESHLGKLAGILCALLSVDERFVYLNPPKDEYQSIRPFNVLTDAPDNPMHVLLKYEELEQRVSNYFHKAFGIDLILN